MSSSSAITSPRLIPTRKVMRLSSAVSAFRSPIPRCTSAAQRTALITLGNSTSIPSPVFFTIRPWVLDLRIDQLPKMRPETLVRPLLVRPHQPRVAGYIGGEDRGEAAFDGLL